MHKPKDPLLLNIMHHALIFLSYATLRENVLSKIHLYFPEQHCLLGRWKQHQYLKAFHTKTPNDCL